MKFDFIFRAKKRHSRSCLNEGTLEKARNIEGAQ